MAISSKNLESLWQRYKAEAVPAGISVNQFFESNGVPYHVFEKWYKKKFQAPNVVECVVAGAPDSTGAVSTPSKLGYGTLAISRSDKGIGSDCPDTSGCQYCLG